MTIFNRTLVLTCVLGPVVLGSARAQSSQYMSLGQCARTGTFRGLDEFGVAGPYHLEMQSDGNLVLYNDWIPIWESSTLGDNQVCLRKGGVLEIWNLEANRCVWSTPPGFSADRPGVFMKIQNDGKLVIYEGSFGDAGRPVSESCGPLKAVADGNDCDKVAKNWCVIRPPRRVRP